MAVLATAASPTLHSLTTGPRWLLAAPLTQTGGRAHRPGAGGTGAALCLELFFFFSSTQFRAHRALGPGSCAEVAPGNL